MAQKFNLRIFQKPITQEDFEGSAKLVKIQFSNDETSYCTVQFHDGETCDRWVDNQQLKAIGAKV